MGRFTKLFAQIEAAGWEISQVDIPADNGWAISIYELISKFSPVGKTIFMTIERDESMSGNSLTEDHAVSIKFNEDLLGRHTDDLFGVNIKQKFESRVALIPELLAEWRNSAECPPPKPQPSPQYADAPHTR